MKFNPEGGGFDLRTAESAGMVRDENGKFGSVVPASDADRKKFGLPEDSYLVLKGRAHPTFRETIKGEKARGSEIIKRGSRYYSVPDTSKKGTKKRASTLDSEFNNPLESIPPTDAGPSTRQTTLGGVTAP